MDINMKNRLWRIIVGSALFAAAIIAKGNIQWLKPLIYAAAYIMVGGDIVLAALKNIVRGEVFDENFLMSLASAGAFFIGEYPEGVAVMLFYQIGELFQSYAVDRSRRSIASLMDIRPDYANVKRGDEFVRADPEEVAVGDIIMIKPGEKIPLDAKVIDGYSTADTSALTGESVPRPIEPGSDILSGCINQSGVITAEVTKQFGESTVSKILDLVENASGKKTKSEQFITKFARYYTPVVVIVAVLLAFLPPLLLRGQTFADWIYRALSFLVVSCPCALVISVPLSFFGGIGGASRSGILIKGGNYLEQLAKTEIVVFDKTGTLTKGVFEVHEIHPQGMPKAELLELTAYAESYSSHPISLSLKRAYGREVENGRISQTEEIPGHGVIAVVDGKRVAAGNTKLMEMIKCQYYKGEIVGTAVHVAVNGEYAGYIVISDEIKDDAPRAVKSLLSSGIKKTVMLTGDAHNSAVKVSHDIGINETYAELLPSGKVEKLEELISGLTKNGRLAYVGDGINDAPVLARADIGIAMGGLGSDAAIEAADVVIMTDEPSKIADAIKISKRTLKIARQNIVFAISVKVIVLILSALSITTMWAAIFADVGVTVLAVLNAFRALNTVKFSAHP